MEETVDMIKNKIHKYIVLALSVLVIILVVLYVLQAKELKGYRDEFPFSKLHEGIIYAVAENDENYQFDDTDEYILIRGISALYSKNILPTEIDETPIKIIYSFKGIASNEFVVPDGISFINATAFSTNTNLRKLVLPATANTIGFGQTEYCYNLVELKVTDLDGNYISENNCIIRKDEMSLIAGCQTSIIPDKVKAIDTHAFMGQLYLKSADIPRTVSSIGYKAFAECLSLKEIYIPSSVVEIENLAFWRCNNLTIYCEAESKPDSWHDDWNLLNEENEQIEVHWDVSREKYEKIISE